MKGSKNQNENDALLNHDIMVHFPKVELHRHLEGTYDLGILHRIALKNKMDVPKDFASFKEVVQFPKDSKPDFLKFLSKFRNDWYKNLDDVRDITYAAVKNLVLDGLYYIELRFNPEHFAQLNDFDRKEVTRIITNAGDIAAKETGLELRYLLTFNRMKQTPKEMIQLYDDLSTIENDKIVGVDLAGDELNFPPEQFREFFDHIKNKKKFSITIHAGEVTPSSQIWTSIDKLHAQRIGHGTSTINDPILQKALIDRHITLEQCITSNYQTGSWIDEKNHPLGRLFKLGVPVTINSDDPHIQDTDLTDDYIKTVKYFGFTLEDLRTANHTALDAAFVNQSEKLRLKTGYDQKFTDFTLKYFKDSVPDSISEKKKIQNNRAS